MKSDNPRALRGGGKKRLGGAYDDNARALRIYKK